ncbi:long-chain fatty acid--CoA ligase [Variovorax sp. WS11]|uniref:fatty acid--CoA ligase n=1 Tax=Variovorax sp. WS11 TaxID=1105204 RepID=UPI000D0D3462|nr:fatty acid--CoA ligase [Variovorax sp. WS11]NDZ17385.1 fatty acid--CoA ligase [Variovorax sp. WS11]PSL86078.1 long-chain fatty acid--CoA ligase [Variovorax sp. WS11]
MSAPRIESTPSAYGYPLLIKQLLHAPLQHAGDQQIVYRDLKRHTYGELRERIGRLAGMLAAQGVGPGDTVAVMDWDSHRYLDAYFAVPMMGATLMTVNVRLSPEQILYTLDHSGAKALLVNAEFAPVVEELLPKLANVETFILLDDAPPGAGHAIPFAGEYEALLAKASADYRFEDFDENTRATVFYTTGTTGLPKGVSFSHRQLVLHTLATMGFMGTSAPGQNLHRGDVYMPITPMFHVHAWGLPYVATALGLKQVYPGRYDPKLLLQLKAREKVTFSHCVPTILQMLLDVPAAESVNLRGWKIVIGGSALSKALAKAALDRGIDVWAGYGMSETCPTLSQAQLKPESTALGEDEQLALRTRSGMPLPLVEMRIVDSEMNPLPHDGQSTGEIVVRAPWLTQAYYRNPDASETLWDGGYLHTQDIGCIDANGYLLITDRLKDVIKSGGEWISSIAIEDLLLQHSGVAEAAVLGIKDEKWGERPIALVVARAGQAGELTEAALKRHLMAYVEGGEISKFAVPATIRFVASIAKTSVGKINKRALRDQYAREFGGQ